MTITFNRFDMVKKSIKEYRDIEYSISKIIPLEPTIVLNDYYKYLQFFINGEEYRVEIQILDKYKVKYLLVGYEMSGSNVVVFRSSIELVGFINELLYSYD